MRKLQLAWAAGLFEGEGTFVLSRQASGSYPRAALVMGDESVVRRFHSIVGVGNFCVESRDRRPSHHKRMYRWQVQNRRDFIAFCDELGPLLSERRQEQIRAVQVEMTPPKKRGPKPRRDALPPEAGS